MDKNEMNLWENIDYQVKTKELVKEAIFLKEYGNKKIMEDDRQDEEFFNEKGSL